MQTGKKKVRGGENRVSHSMKKKSRISSGSWQVSPLLMEGCMKCTRMTTCFLTLTFLSDPQVQSLVGKQHVTSGYSSVHGQVDGLCLNYLLAQKNRHFLFN